MILFQSTIPVTRFEERLPPTCANLVSLELSYVAIFTPNTIQTGHLVKFKVLS